MNDAIYTLLAAGQLHVKKSASSDVFGSDVFAQCVCVQAEDDCCKSAISSSSRAGVSEYWVLRMMLHGIRGYDERCIIQTRSTRSCTVTRPYGRTQLGAVLISVNHNLPVTYSRRLSPRLSFVQHCTGIRLLQRQSGWLFALYHANFTFYYPPQLSWPISYLVDRWFFFSFVKTFRRFLQLLSSFISQLICRKNY